MMSWRVSLASGGVKYSRPWSTGSSMVGEVFYTIVSYVLNKPGMWKQLPYDHCRYKAYPSLIPPYLKALQPHSIGAWPVLTSQHPFSPNQWLLGPSCCRRPDIVLATLWTCQTPSCGGLTSHRVHHVPHEHWQRPLLLPSWTQCILLLKCLAKRTWDFEQKSSLGSQSHLFFVLENMREHPWC